MSGEFERIARIRALAGTSGRGIVLGIGDDAALLSPRPGFDTALSSDLLVEGVHFRLEWVSPDELGYKALAVSLSDMAAMGATPCAALISLAVPNHIGDSFIEAFYEGATGLGRRFETTIVGGDLSRSPSSFVVDSVIVGHVPSGQSLRRDGARGGQDIYVSGELGTSAAGLARLLASGRTIPTDDEATRDVRKHLLPEPRVALGCALVARGLAAAAIDVSDGLSSDLGHVCDASGVGAVIDASSLPAPAGIELALHGGEQYELLFAADATMRAAIAELGRETGVAITRIGRTRGAIPGVWIDREGTSSRLVPSGFDHFRGEPFGNQVT